MKRGYRIHEDTVVAEGGPIAYRYYLSRRRRTLGLSVQADGSLLVRSPAGVARESLRAFVLRHLDWIVATRGKLAARPCRAQRAYEEGTEVLFRGERYRLAVEQGGMERVELGAEKLTVTLPEPADGEKVAALVEEWYLQQAGEIFRQRLAACHRHLEGAGIPLPGGISIRAMRSRWGSYSYRTGRVCLNLHLIRTPPHCLDYVIIHELCHARVRHHGEEFWRLLERFVPDHRQIRNLLRDFSA